MSVTMMKVKGEPIVDNTREPPFVSPLQKYIAENCKQCAFYTGKCRLDDQNGISRMSLCITLYVHQTPDFLKNMIQSGIVPPTIIRDDRIIEERDDIAES